MNKLTPELRDKILQNAYEKYQDEIYPKNVNMRKFMKVLSEILNAMTDEDELHWTADYPCPEYCPDYVVGGCNAGWVVYCGRYGTWKDSPTDDGYRDDGYRPHQETGEIDRWVKPLAYDDWQIALNKIEEYRATLTMYKKGTMQLLDRIVGWLKQQGDI